MKRLIGLDVGTKTLGVSVSDLFMLTAQPVGTITYTPNNFKEVLEKLEVMIAKYEVDKFILGLPKNMNNSASETTKYVLRFEKKLQKHFQKEIILIDERMTTIMAENVLNKGVKGRIKKKQNIDTIASQIILQSYLDRLGGK